MGERVVSGRREEEEEEGLQGMKGVIRVGWFGGGQPRTKQLAVNTESNRGRPERWVNSKLHELLLDGL